MVNLLYWPNFIEYSLFLIPIVNLTLNLVISEQGWQNTPRKINIFIYFADFIDF